MLLAELSQYMDNVFLVSVQDKSHYISGSQQINIWGQNDWHNKNGINGRETSLSTLRPECYKSLYPSVSHNLMPS
jgi:hypothetical protein